MRFIRRVNFLCSFWVCIHFSVLKILLWPVKEILKILIFFSRKLLLLLFGLCRSCKCDCIRYNLFLDSRWDLVWFMGFRQVFGHCCWLWFLFGLGFYLGLAERARGLRIELHSFFRCKATVFILLLQLLVVDEGLLRTKLLRRT